MDLRELQRHWDTFGRTDPFWAILTDPSRRGNKWDPASFFATGRDEVAAHMAEATRLGVPQARRRALDFGCGAGRLTQALADHFDAVVGVDVAPSMVALAGSTIATASAAPTSSTTPPISACSATSAST